MAGIGFKAAVALSVLTGALLAVPVTAGAATLSGSEGTLTYTAAAGQANAVEFAQQGAGAVRVVAFDHDPIAASGTCAEDPANPGWVDCTGIARVVADGGDLDDQLSAGGLIDIGANLTGAGGGDQLVAGPAANVLDGGDGHDGLTSGGGDSVLRGGDGNDNLSPGDGGDVSGGADFDHVSLIDEGNPAPDVSVTLDDQPNDGTPGAGANIHSDIEDVEASSYSTVPPEPPGIVTIVGTAAANQLTGFSGRLNITGGAGNDDLRGDGYDDTLNARDGFADRVRCGDGEDSAIVDTLDVVSSDCETIQTEEVAPPAAGGEDRPPTVAFIEPAGDGARLGTSVGTTLAATASDDRGIAKVVFLDDERVVCEVAAPPYTCEYEPRGEDVGRNTLSAVAIDSSDQAASALRTVTVGLFAPRSVTLEVTPKDTRAPFRFTASGTVNRPEGVARWQACTDGVVTVRIKAGRRTIARLASKLRADCTFRRSATFRNAERFATNRVLKFTARYHGNAVMSAKTSRSVQARTR